MPENKKSAEVYSRRIEKSTVTIGRNVIKTKQALLDDDDKAKIVAETLDVLKLTDEDVSSDGKIIKKDNK